MTTFYYVAVSTSARRKMTGKIESPSEKDARLELNKMGLAILNLTTEKPADFQEADVSEETTFEFVARDKFAKVVNGTIDAADREAAYDRLVSEFHFDVDAVYSSNASAEEKQQAIAEGIRPILEKKAKHKADAESIKKRTLRGGLESLVKFAEGKNKEECAVEIQSLEKNPTTEKVTLESQVSEVEKTPEVAVKITSDVNATQVSSDVKLAAKSKPTDAIRKSLEESILQSKKFFDKFYFRLTELVVPRPGKTRAEAWKDILQLFGSEADEGDSRPANDSAPQVPQHKFSFFNAMDRKAFFQRSWMLAEEVTNILAFVFLGYYMLGNFALRYQWGAFSDLAVKTLGGNTVIPFLAFAFVFIRLLMWLREKFTSWSPLRTSLLFLSGAIFLIFLGINLMH